MQAVENNVVARVYARAALRPQALALVAPGRVMSYASLARAVGVVAGHLRARGIAPGQVVALSMIQRPMLAIALLALAQVGAVALPLHPAIPKARRLRAATRLGAVALLSGRVDNALEGLPFIDLGALGFGADAQADDEVHPVAPETPLSIVISSGTVGDPKAVEITHGRLELPPCHADPEVGPGARVMTMDMNFRVGFRPALEALMRGATLVFPESFTGDDLLHALLAHRVSHATFSPVQARDLAASAAAAGLGCPDLVSLRLVGGVVAPALLREVQQRVSEKTYVVYASTESSLVSIATPTMLAKDPATAGRVFRWARVEVVDDEGKRLPPGVDGQLRIRSAHQAAGYVGADERDRHRFRDGWFYPGDVGHFDADGLLTLSGRGDERINLGGAKCNPEEIEAVLGQHRQVVDAGVFVAASGAGGQGDPGDHGGRGGEVLAAALVLKEAGALAEVERHAAAILGPLTPARYALVSELPRTPTGKLKRGELAALCAPPAAGAVRH